ncbi:DUF624 domain-containing protein [Clostridium sp.]|uniref:DUF624 domain-containing protein n=1 Tax=Clostridium sp. TaxID=1506 RepID=UPI0025BBEAD5|nr:DUF624 domain-containing protein [Clostridium sp.]MBS4955866.1 DUF624 domain-containing protein [Clostridium sp.]MDU4882020.1 DUF624 domain-containing protein [Clostridium celatum]MDU7075384.1 DUF624 domain-containing protein [Clostridium celatum]
MKKEFFEKPLFVVPNYLFNFILNTLYFLLCNLLLIFFFVITSKIPSSFSFIVLFIALIPFGPAFSTLYYCISKLLTEKDIYSHSYFWSFLKDNFMSSFKVWIIELILLLIFIADFQFFYINMPQTKLHFIFALFSILTISISLCTLCINTLFIFKTKDTFLLAVFYMTKKIPIILMKFIAIYLAYAIVNNTSIVLLPFMPGILCVIFFLYDITMIKEIKNKYTVPCISE